MTTDDDWELVDQEQEKLVLLKLNEQGLPEEEDNVEENLANKDCCLDDKIENLTAAIDHISIPSLVSSASASEVQIIVPTSISSEALVQNPEEGMGYYLNLFCSIFTTNSEIFSSENQKEYDSYLRDIFL